VNKKESLTYIHFGGDWKQVRETHPSILFGGGSIVSTPHDLAKFIQALFDLKLISQESLNLMKTIRDGDGSGMEPSRSPARPSTGTPAGATTTERGWLTCRKKS